MLYNEGDLLQAVLDIQNYLADHNFTYGDALDLLKMCEAELNATMDHYAYPTFEDWAKKQPSCNVLKMRIERWDKDNM